MLIFHKKSGLSKIKIVTDFILELKQKIKVFFGKIR